MEYLIGNNGRFLKIGNSKGTFKFSPTWLIENSQSPLVRDRRTNQLLIESAKIDRNLRISDIDVSEERMNISFSDGTSHFYEIDDLLPKKRKVLKKLWNRSTLHLPRYDFTNFDEKTLKDMLVSIEETGFCLIKNMPVSKNGILALSKYIGPIKETNWGNIADIRNIKKAYDLTMTERALENHTDNPYRFPVQGYIFLHCIKNSEHGGENTLVDGFNVCQEIRNRNRKNFNTLKNFKTFFQYKDENTLLENFCSLIEVDHNDDVIQVRYNNRTEIIPYDAIEKIDDYTVARKNFWELINKKSNNLVIKQEPGDMLIMDNYRILHGRKGYKDSGNQRYFRQGYMDRDILQSKLKILSQGN